MAVLPMKKIEIYGLNRNRKQILELLQRSACVEISDVEIPNEEIFEKSDISSAKNLFETNQKTLLNAVSVLDDLVKPDSSGIAMFEGRKAITDAKYKEIEKNSHPIIKSAQNIVSISKKLSDIKADIIRNETSIEALEPWKNLDIGMRIRETENAMIFIGTLPEEYSEGELKEVLAKEIPTVSSLEIEVISSIPSQTCIIAICHKKVCSQVETALRSIGFSYPSSPSKLSPKERIAELQKRINVAKIEIEKNESEINKSISLRENFIYCHDYLIIRTERYEALSKIIRSKKTFGIYGFVPAKDSEKIEKKLTDKFTCHVEIFEPSDNDDVPVKLQNNGFAAPVEGVIESYSLPKKGEIDPSPILAFFYYVLFGMMFSDAGYGLIMIIACSVVLFKYTNMEIGMKNTVKMFLYCGFSTFFWGLMFGSFFGDLIDVVGATFFNASWSTPCLWYNPIDGPMTLLMLSLLFGVIHLFTGLGIKMYMLCKAGHVKDAIYDVVFWYLLIGGGIIYFMSMQMFADISGLGFMLPTSVGTVGAVLAGIGAIGIVATTGRASKSPAVKVMKGIYGLYGATSYLSDILSYSRLLALGLATGVIATVFNQIAAMGGKSIVGVIMFILVFAAGHALNFGLNVLGAYVHSNRLEYVEFFGKFYEGGGRKFMPFSENTKHFKITEEK